MVQGTGAWDTATWHRSAWHCRILMDTASLSVDIEMLHRSLSQRHFHVDTTKQARAEIRKLHCIHQDQSIERFIEDQAFLPSYDLAPPPTPLSRQ